MFAQEKNGSDSVKRKTAGLMLRGCFERWLKLIFGAVFGCLGRAMLIGAAFQHVDFGDKRTQVQRCQKANAMCAVGFEYPGSSVDDLS